jgi:predicted DNA-binding transcriptional regulator AlpA
MLSLVAAAVVGVSEIAELLGVTPQRAGQIARDYADFPAPITTLAAGRVWDRQAVKAWIAKHPDRRGGRPPKKRTEREDASS